MNWDRQKSQNPSSDMHCKGQLVGTQNEVHGIGWIRAEMNHADLNGNFKCESH